jgi:hypothetical protein
MHYQPPFLTLCQLNHTHIVRHLALANLQEVWKLPNFGVLFWWYLPKNVSGDWEHVSCCCDNQILLTYKHFNRIQSPQHGKRWEHQYRYICCICTQASLVCIQIGLPWPSTFIFIHWRTPSRLLVTTTVCLHINQLGILVNDFLSALQS